MKTKSSVFLIMMAGLLLLASCSNSQHPKKCNGKRGTRVPMGIL